MFHEMHMMTMLHSSAAIAACDEMAFTPEAFVLGKKNMRPIPSNWANGLLAKWQSGPCQMLRTSAFHVQVAFRGRKT